MAGRMAGRQSHLQTGCCQGGRGRDIENKEPLTLVAGRIATPLTKLGGAGGGAELRGKDDEPCFTQKDVVMRLFLPVVWIDLYQENSRKWWVGSQGPAAAALPLNGQGQDPSHFLSAGFTDKLQWCFTRKLFLEKKYSVLIKI